MTTTRSVRLHAVGESPRLEDAPLAAPADGEILVELDHAAVNPLDTYVAAGLVGGDAPLPRTLGIEAPAWWTASA